ncbi:hypothetical protein ACIBO2_25060 [Nonomuraea sp. NPDC050022]|uniref:hypothetical protein n=1 Tax=Nonomuraea sp. NPDC050022 TaxID=3364358 RepID=UPI0037A9F9CF
MALCVAVASQVIWAVTAAVKTSSSRGVVVSGAANFALGLAIVELKAVVAARWLRRAAT